MDLSNKYLKAWLTFNKSPTDDAKLNNWETFGNPTIGTANAFNGNALQLDGQSYLKLSGVELGGRDFYIDGWVYVDSSSPNYARIISIVNPSNGNYLVSVRKNSSDATKIDFWRNSTADVSKDNGYTAAATVTSVGTRVHFKLIYRYTDKVFHLCINDNTYVGTTSNNYAVQYNRQTFDIYIGANARGSQGLIGTIDELRIYDGKWFSYNYNNPPTLADYQNITFSSDFERKVQNAPLNWRYENYGTADLLSSSGTTLTDLPVTQSKTGSAFYQTARAKCFDIPATKEIWLKFDVYPTLAQRWRAYNNNTNGVCSYTDGTFAYWANSVVAKEIAGKVKNQLQTVLLHMISDSSAGVIEAWLDDEKLYTYIGNVNNGEDFADIFLQSDGEGTFFSNVIISNTEITLNDNVSPLGYKMTWQFDIDWAIQKSVSADFDFERIINGYFLPSFDIERKVIHTVNFSCDFERVIDNSNIFSFDIIRKLIRTTNFSADIVRNLSHKLIITPAENGVFTDETNSTGVQSIEINLAAQQLTDRLSFTAINNAEIMQQVKGKYLDYNFDMRIEKIVERGVLKTCHCCSDIDELLFTQIAYKVTKVVGGVYVTDENKKVTMVEKPKASASSHIQKIAEILGKKTVLLFEDFISTVDIEQGGVTYNDLIRELFGWSARVPPRLINCYIRDDTLYVIQRGYEQNVIDLTDEHITRPTVTREIIRTTWAATSATTKLTNRNNITKDWEPILGGTISEPEPQPEPEPEPNPEPEPEQPKRVLPKQKVITENGITTTINYEYDEDGNVTKVTTTTDENMIIVEYKYEEIDGRKYLAQETTQEWVSTENGLELFDEKIIHHDYLTQGQRNSTGTDSDGEPFHSQTTLAPFDSRPTPFTERQSGGFSPSDFKPTKIEPSGERQKFFDKLKGYTYNENGDKVEVLGYKSSNKEVQGILLFDSSFPIDNNLSKSFLYRITGEIERLNRRTQETVTFDLLGYPHVIDFNDRIILAGRTFFLVSNTVVKTPRIVNKQSLQLVRWY